MTATNVRVQMQQRRDTAANWTSADPTLLAGELGYESDTGKLKIGDGSTAWSSLAYEPGFSLSAYPLATSDIADDAITGDKLANDITIANDLTVTGDLTVNGTTTTINSTTLQVDDKNIELGTVGTPTDVTADGGGITLKGTTDHTILWTDSTDSWDFSEHVNIASGKEFRIDGTKVLDATGLGSSVVSSSLTSVGTIATGVWNGTAIATAYIADDAVTSAKIADGTIVNADVNASAAIVGTKIDPDFGAQNVSTTGTVAANEVDTPTVNNASASSGGIAIDSDGHVQIDGQQLPNAGSLSNRNLLFNGNFQINQRGGTNSTINTYSLDRWRSYGGPMGFTISQQDVLSTLSTSKYALRLQRTSGNTQTNNIGVVQGIESKNCEGLAGTKLTLSFKARVGANFSQASDQLQSTVFYGQGTDENPVGMTSQSSTQQDNDVTTSFATFTQTVTVPASTTQISVGFSYTPAGTAGADDYFDISEVQLERGDVATPFERRGYGDELEKCKRYYQTVGSVFAGETEGADRFTINAEFKPEVRVSPTCTVFSGREARIRYAGSDVSITTPTLNNTSTTIAGVWTRLTTSGRTNAKLVTGRGTGGIDSQFIQVDAEL